MKEISICFSLKKDHFTKNDLRLSFAVVNWTCSSFKLRVT